MHRTHVRLALAAATLLPLLSGAARPAAAQLRPAAPGVQIPVSAEQLAGRLGVKRAALIGPARARILTRIPVRFEVTNVGSGTYFTRVYSQISYVTAGGQTSAPCRGAHPPEVESSRNVTAVNGTLSFADTLFFYESAHGQTCPLYIALRKLGDAGVPRDTVYAGSIQVDRLETYTISQTWSLIPHVSAITPLRVGDADGSCTGLSAGLSGIISIGVVEHNNDISLHIRSGINRADCVFDSAQPTTLLNTGWVIVDREWAVTRIRGNDDACGINNYAAGEPGGTRFYIHAQMYCGGGPDNDSGVRLTLKSITLLGPPGKSAMDAFAH